MWPYNKQLVYTHAIVYLQYYSFPIGIAGGYPQPILSSNKSMCKGTHWSVYYIHPIQKSFNSIDRWVFNCKESNLILDHIEQIEILQYNNITIPAEVKNMYSVSTSAL